MRYIEEKILKTLEEDIEILKGCYVSNNLIKEYIEVYKDYSNDNTEEFKKEIDKLIEEIK